MGYRERAVEYAIVTGKSDTAQNFFGGTMGAIGGGYGVYEFMQSTKLNKAWDNIVADWQDIRTVLNDYVTSVNELIVIYDNAYVLGIVPDDNTVNQLMAHIADLERQLDDLVKDLNNQTDAADDSKKTTGLLGWVWSWIEGACQGLHPSFWQVKYTVIGLGGYFLWRKTTGVGITQAGKGVYRSWEKIRDYFNDRNHPGGTAVVCDLCHEEVTAPTSEMLKLELQRHLVLRHTVNVSAAMNAVPNLVYELSQMPAWVQNSLALEVGMRSDYVLSEAEWSSFFQSDWRTVVGTMGVLVLTAVALYYGASWAGGVGRAIAALEPAFVVL